jgi:hypothetical protein
MTSYNGSWLGLTPPLRVLRRPRHKVKRLRLSVHPLRLMAHMTKRLGISKPLRVTLSHPASVIETIPHTANPRTRLENYRQQTIDKNPHQPTTVGIASDGHTEHYGTSVPPGHSPNPLPQGEAKGIRKQRTMSAYDANHLPRAGQPNDCQWGPGQCAEFKTIPPLVDRHSTTSKHIDTLTVNTKSGQPMKMCPNCEKMAETMTNRIPKLSIQDHGPGGKKYGPKRSNTI